MSKNFYEILNAEPNSTSEELKIKYKHLILQYHPDKNQEENHANEDLELQHAQHISHTPTSDIKTTKFLKINEAWNTLKDEEKRKKYDACLLLKKLETYSNVFAEVDLKDMELHDVSRESNGDFEPYFTLNCRCGGQYIFDDIVSETASKTTIECTECSLVIILNM